ncbi:MAG: hypothetical protein ABI954_08090 [Pyrinomonadaceae bacterium]
MDNYSSWIGFGFKGGGILGIGGVDYLSGTMRNVGFLSEHHDFQVLSARLGLGLGGSVGAVACFVYNCSNLYALNDTIADDWSINVALEVKWDAIADGLKNFKFFPTLAKLGAKAAGWSKATPGDITNLRNGMSYIYTAQDIVTMNGSPKLVTIDIPGAGVGYELSASFSKGKIEILD